MVTRTRLNLRYKYTILFNYVNNKHRIYQYEQRTISQAAAIIYYHDSNTTAWDLSTLSLRLQKPRFSSPKLAVRKLFI